MVNLTITASDDQPLGDDQPLDCDYLSEYRVGRLDTVQCVCISRLDTVVQYPNHVNFVHSAFWQLAIIIVPITYGCQPQAPGW